MVLNCFLPTKASAEFGSPWPPQETWPNPTISCFPERINWKPSGRRMARRRCTKWSLGLMLVAVNGFIHAYGAINDPRVFVILADRMQVALEIDACATDVTSLGWGGVGMLTFMLTCVTCTTDVTSLGWVGDVNVHVNLRDMHNWRHVTGLGWGGDVNVHVNLRHMHNWRHVTGLGWGGDVNVHVNLRHMHNWRHVTGKGELKNEFCWMTGDQMWLNLSNRRKKTIILLRRVENRWTIHTKRTFGSWPQCNYDLTFLSRFYKPCKYHDLVNEASWKIHDLPRVANRAVALFMHRQHIGWICVCIYIYIQISMSQFETHQPETASLELLLWEWFWFPMDNIGK